MNASHSASNTVIKARHRDAMLGRTPVDRAVRHAGRPNAGRPKLGIDAPGGCQIVAQHCFEPCRGILCADRRRQLPLVDRGQTGENDIGAES
jgi:hypothetical protein